MWKKKRPASDRPPHPLLQRLGLAVRGRQQKLAGSLNAGARHWSKKQKILFGGLLCGFLLGVNILFVVTDLAPKLSIRSIQPVPLYQELINKMPATQFSHTDSAAVLAFRQRLDSLARTPEGRARLKDFLRERPGLMDSMLVLERRLFGGRAVSYDSSTHKKISP